MLKQQNIVIVIFIVIILSVKRPLLLFCNWPLGSKLVVHWEELTDVFPVLHFRSLTGSSLFCRGFEPDWDSLVSSHSLLSSVSGAEECYNSSSAIGCKCLPGLKLVAGSGPPQLGSISVCFHLFRLSLIKLNTEVSLHLLHSSAVKVNLVKLAVSSPWRCSPSPVLHSSFSSSLICGSSGGSSWSRLELHSCCSRPLSRAPGSAGTSSLTNSCWTSSLCKWTSGWRAASSNLCCCSFKFFKWQSSSSYSSFKTVQISLQQAQLVAGW